MSSSGVAPMKPSMAKVVHDGWRARRRPRRSAWRRGRFACTVHLAGENDLVEASAPDLGQGGADPVQEVLVRPCRREPEIVWRRSAPDGPPARDDLGQAGVQLTEKLSDSFLRADDEHRGGSRPPGR